MERGVRKAFWHLGLKYVPLFHITVDKRSDKPPQIKLPKKFLKDDIVFIVDDVISTGKTMDIALQEILKRGEPTIIVIVLIVSPLIYDLFIKYPSIRVVCIDFDPLVDEKGFLVPGLGDNDKMIFGALEENRLER